MSKRILLSFGVGILITFVFLWLAAVADNAGAESLSQTLLWQNTLLQSFVPTPNIGATSHPVHEGTPINFLAFLLSVPLGFFIYGAIAYVAIGLLGRRQQAPTGYNHRDAA